MNRGRAISDILAAKDHPLLSVEFFPPKDDAGGELIVQTALEIQQQVQPDFVSITYGAGGTTQERTYRYARILRDQYGFEVMPHFTCVGNSKAEVVELVGEYWKDGFVNLMALRGDPPKGETDFTPHPDGCHYASELVELLKGHYPELCMGVAAYPEVHPQAVSAEDDLRHLKSKIDKGGSFATTQLFYDNRNYFSFVEKARAIGIDAPIIPGLMPIRSGKQARRFCNHIPAELDAMLEKAGDDTEAVHRVGVDWCFRQIQELLEGGAPGVHLYIMNRSNMVVELAHRLREAGLWQPAIKA
ncbi:MAG: methylenetetrahydrofolate reductase [NAD(P)H] [Verrucomicrobiota bacterium JB022]|nr:methylenetetrahydrofolate reductase [NAD(P)H] [Verrucomicrobiota bacterium JB022]